MHAHAVEVAPPARDCDDAVQEPAALEAVVRDVLVLERQKTVARQDRVAVMTVVVHRVAPIDVLPGVAGEKRMLRLDRRAGEAQGEAPVQALHFLQEHEIRIEQLQALAQLMDHHAPVEVRQPFVDVERDNPETLALHCSPSIAIASRLDHEKHFAAASRQGDHANAKCSSSAMRTGTRPGSSSAKTCSTLFNTPGAKRLRHCRYISNV